MVLGWRTRLLALAVLLVAAGATTVPAQAAPLGSVLRLPVSGLVAYSTGTFAVDGVVNLTVPRCTPPNAIPTDPCRITATILRLSATDQTTGTVCQVRGSPGFPAARTGTFTGVYIPTDPCRELMPGGLAIRYRVSTSESDDVTATAEALGPPVT
jgi:hypothetical protein